MGSCQSPDVQKQCTDCSLCFSISLEQSVPDVLGLCCVPMCSSMLSPTSCRNVVKQSLDCHGQQPEFLSFGAYAKELEQMGHLKQELIPRQNNSCKGTRTFCKISVHGTGRENFRFGNKLGGCLVQILPESQTHFIFVVLFCL